MKDKIQFTLDVQEEMAQFRMSKKARERLKELCERLVIGACDRRHPELMKEMTTVCRADQRDKEANGILRESLRIAKRDMMSALVIEAENIGSQDFDAVDSRLSDIQNRLELAIDYIEGRIKDERTRVVSHSH